MTKLSNKAVVIIAFSAIIIGILIVSSDYLKSKKERLDYLLTNYRDLDQIIHRKKQSLAYLVSNEIAYAKKKSKGDIEKAKEVGYIGIFTGMFEKTSPGIIVVIVLSFAISLIAKPKG